MKMVESTRLYFAYGAMLSPRTLERRGIRPVGPVLRAKLPNYRLVFDHRAGFGTLVATENKHEVGEREREREVEGSIPVSHIFCRVLLISAAPQRPLMNFYKTTLSTL